MAQLLTAQFGEIAFGAEQVIDFPAGLPAFETLRRFLLLQREHSAIGTLQSVDEPHICFPVIPVGAIAPSYEIEPTAEDLVRLAVAENDQPELLTLAILTVTESGQPTANLLAPILIHARARRGVQCVRSDFRYSHEHVLSNAPLDAASAEGQASC